MNKAIKKIADALLTVTEQVYHYKALKQTDQYIVLAEDGQTESSWADDICTYQVVTGTIDYFTKTEYDPNVEKIQCALNDGNIVWYLNSVQYEEDTKYKHYEWVWEVPNES